MKLVIGALAAILAFAFLAPAAEAKHKSNNRSGHLPAEMVHNDGPGHKHLGYWRNGPSTGYGFAFSSYPKDPFGSDDYTDRNGCFYRGHGDFCLDFIPPRGLPH